MARIAYGLAGEGRGHCIRAIGLGLQLIQQGHEVRFFTSGDAVPLLVERFGEEAVHPLPVPRFVYGRRGVAIGRTLAKNARFILLRRRVARPVIEALDTWAPDMVISDFEPIMPTAARTLGRPLVCFNSQHFASVCTMKKHLSLVHRVRTVPIALLARLFLGRADLTIVSKPFALPLRDKEAHLVGPVLRNGIKEAVWEPQGTHVLAYLRGATDKILDELFEGAKKADLNVRLYGVHPSGAPSHVEARGFSERGFMDDLRTADVVVSTAGSQLIGEVAHLGCTTVLVPEPGQIEQDINARLAATLHGNILSVRVGEFRADLIQRANLGDMPHEAPFDDGAKEAAKLVARWWSERVQGNTTI